MKKTPTTSVHDIVEELARNKLIEELVNNIAPADESYKEDLVQDLYIELLNKPPDNIINLYQANKLKYFIVRMVMNNINSKTSPFYYRYKKNAKKHIQITPEMEDRFLDE